MKIPFNNDWIYNDDFNALPEGASVRIPHTVAVTPYDYFDESIYQKISGYQKDFELPDGAYGKKIFLVFDGVAHKATVYVNGKEIVTHNCGYTAFEADITDAVKLSGTNTVKVRVDSNETLNIPPFGYVIDYMTYGGIYREVRLEIRPENHISDVFARAGSDGILDIDVTFSKTDVPYSICLKEKASGNVVYTAENVTDTHFASGKIDGIRLWDTDDPFLYELTVSSADDEYMTTIGFRDSEFKADGYYLNGRKLKIRGLNRHQSYPYVGYAMPASMQRYDADIMKNELGLNAVRTSHYPQSQHFIDRCDELGLLVFTEIPGWQHIGNDEWKAQAVKNVEEMIIQYRNHPSIVLWGVRINESVDDDELYKKTNETAHRLDPSRPTGGVRYLKKSSFLEDVYTYNDFSHDGKTPGVDPKKKVATNPDAPYLISEYNGHMFPTKPFDSEEHRLEHALRHANVLDAVAGYDDIAGSFGWCFFDYNTHQDFGSGDRICYHGVTDMFRNPKQASYVYSACGDLKEPFLEVSSTFDIGEHPAGNRGKTYIYTNCDSVKMYKNDLFIKEYTHKDTVYKNLRNAPILIDDLIGDQMKENEGFSDRQNKIVKEAMNYIGIYGMNDIPAKIKMRLVEAMAVYHMKFEDAYQLFGKYIGNWGGTTLKFVFEGYKDGKPVKTISKTAFKRLHMEVKCSSDKLFEKDTYDVAALRITVCDEYGNVQPFFNDSLPMEIEGAGEIIGPARARISGGAGGTYIRSCGEGKIKLKISCPEGYEGIFEKDSMELEFTSAKNG
ncbi:glycoside hydrolase family 2 protein [Butyrivibrio sp. AE2032]|uniref:glycoside hydrolase family 2 protein n=1 Tax=Butyrivibrio sp. AE2032 TaxID=1458463 RepID=UPI0005514486|nr:glycoside hydrolase family 2 TIM barrel-domain containing protein [Butyrivibrio sp. AE2032]